MTALVLSFATFWTAHLALAAGLGARGPWWRGALALVVVPLAGYWGMKGRLRVRTAVWLVGLVTYVAARIAAGAAS